MTNALKVGADADTLAMFADSIRRSLAAYPDRLGLAKAGAVEPGAIDVVFAAAVEQGWLAIAAPESLGGLDLGMAGVALLATEIGRRLAPGPFFANAAMVPFAAAITHNDALGALVGTIISGERRVHLALPSRSLNELRWIVEAASETADVLSVEETEGRTILRLLPGAAIAARQAFDPTSPVGELVASPNGSTVELTIELQTEQAGRLIAAANIWIAAELLGVAESAGELSIRHAGQRKQFGQPIGAYQAVKHRIVDDYVLRQNATAILGKAVKAWDSSSPDSILLAHAARAAASEAATRSTAHAIQVHGAMGFSWEHPAHLYYKRVRRILPLLGGAEQSLAAVGDLLAAGAI